MSDRISQAFGHPLARAIALSGEDPLDRISLRDHVAEVEIGAFQSERGHTQRLRFNIVVEVARSDSAAEDDVDRILSYDTLTEAIAAELHAERLNLLETLAERVALRVLHEPLAVRVYVRIEKLDRGPGALGVEIVRSRDDAPLAAEAPAEAPQHPVVVHLSGAAVQAAELSGWLDRYVAERVPVILTVGLPDGPVPQSAARLAQRRIDLLAIEQNAWVLAGRDARCVVVNTRTELDWAMKHGQISVWAPSKIVLDAVEGPGVAVRDGPRLAAWFAGLMDARELVVVDDTAPEATVPVRAVASGDGP
ncbi:dihydroneopterin aldolase [Pseudooceanicola sp. LIPI14-2-Ac024]|uniref:dihydroneopterin aldolase n=1 Tax=Pseudooceanicola sp. LIPI14-2-Ac024 TaxID=3344875 RepID=UPI0035D112B3